MIIIETETNGIVMNPKVIYIEKDLEGYWHLYADMSDTDRIKPEPLTVKEYSQEQLNVWLQQIYKGMWQQGRIRGDSIFISIRDVMKGRYFV